MTLPLSHLGDIPERLRLHSVSRQYSMGMILANKIIQRFVFKVYSSFKQVENIFRLFHQQGGLGVKTIIVLFSLPLFFLSCDSEPVSDYNDFIESVSEQTYTTVWFNGTSEVVLKIRKVTEEQTLPFVFKIDDERYRGHISLGQLTKKGDLIEAPLVETIDDVFVWYTLENFEFRPMEDGSYALENAVFSETTPFWFKPIRQVLEFPQHVI